VYPASVGNRTTKAPLSAAVLQASGSTATSDALAALGVTTRTIADPSSLPAGDEVLVLGEGANITATSEQVSALTEFVRTRPSLRSSTGFANPVAGGGRGGGASQRHRERGGRPDGDRHANDPSTEWS
jgi:hypothetical protein